MWAQRVAVAVPEDGEGVEGEEAAPESASFDYLLSMPIHSLTREKARAVYPSALTPISGGALAALDGHPSRAFRASERVTMSYT